MSLANTCDRCKKVITGPAVTDKEDFDVAVIVDGEPYYVCEDMCPECRADFVSLVDRFKRLSSPVRREIRDPDSEKAPEPERTGPETPLDAEKGPDEPAPATSKVDDAKTPYRTIDEDELPNAVTKRFPLPRPISPTQGTSQ